MSADIEKLAVFDSRIVQSRPKYAVEKGALSLTNAPFNAIAATASQHTYNIYVPSENVYVDRAVEWSSQVYQQFTVTLSDPPADSEVIVQAGKDFALRSFPLNALCSTLTATINDTTSVINTQDVLDPVLRLADYRKNRLQRTCPTMLDKYASYNDAHASINNPLAGYENTTEYGEVPNGAFYNLVYTGPDGAPLPSAPPGGAAPLWPAYALAGGATAKYSVVNGVPVAAPAWDAGTDYVAGQIVRNGVSVWLAVTPVTGTAPAGGAWTNLGSQLAYPVYVSWRSTEKLVLSPFVFADCHEWDTGLFGINNIQLIMNLRDSSRTIRSTTRDGRTLSAIGYNTGVSGGPFSNAVVNVQFLTPSLDVPLPPKSVVPYMEFPRYITTGSQAIQPGQPGQLQSQTITLPQIPDLFIIYCKGSAGVSGPLGPTDADFYLPLATAKDQVRNPLSINFDNFSGLLSSTTAEQLYGMSVKNGLEMDFNQWAGLAHSQAPGAPAYPALGSDLIPLNGGFLVLKPSQDVTLQTGQAPSLVGNFTFQFNITVKNNTAVPQTPSLYVITANSGFFESIRGSSRIIKGVLSEQDIISAPLAPMGTRDALARYVGGASGGFNFGNMLSKLKDAGMAGLKRGAEHLVTGKATGAGTGGAGAGRSGLAGRLM